MKNVEMSIDGNIMTIKVDLSKDFGPSTSGKSIVIASSEGLCLEKRLSRSA